MPKTLRGWAGDLARDVPFVRPNRRGPAHCHPDADNNLEESDGFKLEYNLQTRRQGDCDEYQVEIDFPAF